MGSRPAGVSHKHSQTCDLDKSLWQQESLDKEKGGSLSLIELKAVQLIGIWSFMKCEVRVLPCPHFVGRGATRG